MFTENSVGKGSMGGIENDWNIQLLVKRGGHGGEAEWIMGDEEE